jgi:hypothetical protein
MAGFDHTTVHKVLRDCFLKKKGKERLRLDLLLISLSGRVDKHQTGGHRTAWRIADAPAPAHPIRITHSGSGLADNVGWVRSAADIW